MASKTSYQRILDDLDRSVGALPEDARPGKEFASFTARTLSQASRLATLSPDLISSRPVPKEALGWLSWLQDTSASISLEIGDSCGFDLERQWLHISSAWQTLEEVFNEQVEIRSPTDVAGNLDLMLAHLDELLLHRLVSASLAGVEEEDELDDQQEQGGGRGSWRDQLMVLLPDVGTVAAAVGITVLEGTVVLIRQVASELVKSRSIEVNKRLGKNLAERFDRGYPRTPPGGGRDQSRTVPAAPIRVKSRDLSKDVTQSPAKKIDRGRGRTRGL